MRPLMIGLFLAGLVIHGGLQGWWVVELLEDLADAGRHRADDARVVRGAERVGQAEVRIVFIAVVCVLAVCHFISI